MRLLIVILLVLLQAAAQAQTVISYSRTDRAQAERLRQALQLCDEVFIDRDVQAGAEWRPEMAERIRSARRLVLLWSTRSASSMEVGAEWRMALAWGVPVVPVLLDDTPLPAALSDRQAIDWR
ncbi:MAG: toll/interleukin-1 receptor domain-containing protein [Piscinibacter sp.]|uniref:toll/interleukin-1 receptor domain-containing protein n=1 Tax=Piscinibacter sp. TaxID=1903157 RepID=UPI002584C8E2|nr:toll/interleukin-1 receptor domain-containing protein [Piscinibacter sp.]MCW5666527.1 toll/interleukin-1 receptor domain-containing protein [Piscinibacter sp.]